VDLNEQLLNCFKYFSNCSFCLDHCWPARTNSVITSLLQYFCVFCVFCVYCGIVRFLEG